MNELGLKMNSIEFANKIRLIALELCFQNRSSHLGGSFSMAEILAVLYGKILNLNPDNPNDPLRDRLFYSKGHACAALYAALSIRGFFSQEKLLSSFTKNGSYFTSHINHHIAGVELSTGSLGHALGVSCGSAVAAKRQHKKHMVFTIVSDGELDEGSNWEAILFAAHHRLDNLVLIIDYNKIQSFGRTNEIMMLEPLAKKFEAFNWDVQEVDGHCTDELFDVLDASKSVDSGKPKCIIAHTIKGKGVGFMEDKLEWHYRSPSEADYKAARIELGAE